MYACIAKPMFSYEVKEESSEYSGRIQLDEILKRLFYIHINVFEIRKKINRAKFIDRDSAKYDRLITEIKGAILKVSKEILEHIETVYNEKKIDDAEYNEFGIVITNLTQYLCKEIDKLSDIEEEVDEMIKTFYDPKVEERGIQKGEQIGIEKGEQKGRLNTKREDILELLEDVGTISEDIKRLVEQEEDLEVLRKWLKMAAKVSSIDEFRNKIELN